VRLGYELPSAAGSPSRGLQAELIVRALAMPDGAGMMAGVGAAWR
jgi:hypothetical protein